MTTKTDDTDTDLLPPRVQFADHQPRAKQEDQPTPFVIDPAVAKLGVVEMPMKFFFELPNHPQQRNTGVHAALLVEKNVLTTPLPQHRDVEVVLVGKRRDIAAAFEADPIAAIRKYGEVLNAHSRRQVWVERFAPVPESVSATIYWAADPDASFRLYRSYDNVVASKGIEARTQSVLRVLGIEAQSDLVKRAKPLGKAIAMASAILHDGTLRLQQPLLHTINAQTIAEGLPLLEHARIFREQIITLDGLSLGAHARQGEMPVSSAAVAAYLAALHHHADKGAAFLASLNSDAGTSIEGDMSPAFAVRNAVTNLRGSRPRNGWKSSEMDAQIVALILTAYLAFIEGTTLKSYEVPTRIIGKFFAKRRP